MSTIQVNGRMAIDPRNLEEVARLCESMISATREEVGLLEYSFWVNDDRDTVFVREHYEDEAALMEHLEKLNRDVAGELSALIEMQALEVAAKRTPAIEKALGGFGVEPTFFEPLCSR